MLRLEEKLKERGNQKKHLEKIDKYPVVDDPRRISQLLKEMTDSFSSLSEQEMEFRVRRVVQDNSVYGFPLSKKELNRRLTQMGRKDMHQLNALALAYSNNFEKITPFFIESDRDLLRNWARLSLSKVSYFKKNNGEIVRILPSAFFNPLTAWFVDDAYLDLDESVRFLTENLTDNGEVEEKVYLLMLLGHLSGKFTQPESVQYKRFFRQFIHRDSPALLRELIQITDDERPEYEHKQERLQKLKSYWHEVFVQAWMAKAKLQYDGRKALSQADQIIGQQNLGMDMRPSDTIKGAESFGMSLEMKSPHLEGEGQRQAEMYQAEELHLERKAKESKWNAQQYMSEVLQLYNLNHTLLINKEGRTEGKWSRFRQKIPLIFQLAVSQGKDLMKKSASIGERATILDNVAIQLIDVIDRDQDCLDLFGHDFYEINPIEQVSLILFTALSLAGEKERPRLLVQLCSRALVPHLLEYQISKKKEDVTVGNDRVSLSEVDWKSYQGVAYNAFNKMNHMPIESGFCHSDSQELNSIASEVDQVTKELSDIILTPKFKEQSGRRKFVLAGLFVLANLYFGIQIGDKIGSFLDEKNFNEVQAIFLMLILQAFVGLATYVFVRNFGSKKVFKKLKESDFLEVVNELQELIPEEKKASSRLRSIVMSGITIAIFSFSALRVYSDFLEDASGVQEVLPESSGPPSIPDQISPESLTQLPWVLRGSLNYIPEGMDPESTIPVGYQSDYWLNESGSGFSTSGDHGTAAVELVSSQADIDYVPSENEIMYSVPMRSLKLLPLDGYRITRLFQVGGKPAERGTAGEYYFDVNDYPDSVVIVAERMQPDEHFGNGIVSYSEIRGPGYQPWDNWLEKRNDAVALNSKLSGDLQLQQLHLSLIQEIDLLYARWQTGGGLSSRH